MPNWLAPPGTITRMELTVTTDADEICALLDRFISADPIRHTVLGSILAILQSGTGSGWCAHSPDGSALAVRSDLHTPLVLVGHWESVPAIVDVLRGLPMLRQLTGAVSWVDTVASALWPVATDRTAMRLFRLDSLAVPSGVSGFPRLATIDDHSMLVEWFTAFSLEARDGAGGDPAGAVDRALEWGRVWLWTLDGAPVSVAARRGPVAGAARIGPVYTPQSHRGRGYGSAVTAVATRDILDEAAVPVLFTDLANPTSNAIYRRLGYRPVADFAEVALR